MDSQNRNPTFLLANNQLIYCFYYVLFKIIDSILNHFCINSLLQGQNLNDFKIIWFLSPALEQPHNSIEGYHLKIMIFRLNQ